MIKKKQRYSIERESDSLGDKIEQGMLVWGRVEVQKEEKGDISRESKQKLQTSMKSTTEKRGMEELTREGDQEWYLDASLMAKD